MEKHEEYETTWWSEHGPVLLGAAAVLSVLAGSVWLWLTWPTTGF